MTAVTGEGAQEAPGTRRYRKRPVTLCGIPWDGANREAVLDFAGLDETGPCATFRDGCLEVWNRQEQTWFPVPVGHVVMRGALGELYGVSPEAIARAYTPARDGDTRTPGQAVYEGHQDFIIRQFPGITRIAWDELPEDVQGEWEVIAGAAVDAGGWDALAAEIEALEPGEGLSTGSTILAQVTRAVVARVTGTKPQGNVKVDLESDGGDGARVTIAWGTLRDDLENDPAQDDDPFGASAFRGHSPGCGCPDCREAREDAASVAGAG